MYKLKGNQSDFTVVDGAFANHTYRAGQVYAQVPPEEKNRFEEIGPRMDDRGPKGEAKTKKAQE